MHSDVYVIYIKFHNRNKRETGTRLSGPLPYV